MSNEKVPGYYDKIYCPHAELKGYNTKNVALTPEFVLILCPYCFSIIQSAVINDLVRTFAKNIKPQVVIGDR